MKIRSPDQLLRNQMVSLKLSEMVRDYAYLILTSQTSMRGPIVSHEARNLDAQRVFLNIFENIVNRRVDIPGITKVSKDLSIC